jgi:hypothetical protein
MNRSGEMELYDEEQTYDERIAPLMAQIIAICKERGIPMLASFAFHNTADEGLGLCTTYLGEQVPARHPDVLRQCYQILYPQPSGFKITTEKANGEKSVEMVVVVP